ncbi:MAG: transcriptional repressor NrdR [Myxococcales bacterium]|nr:transcriptional repressor NrdR [Myxococcales bacterium]
MLCPVCRGANIKVLDSRDSRDGGAIRRRRSCPDCGHRFTTYERIEISLPVVIKRGGARQAFDRQKLLGGLKSACRKRPVDDESLEAIVAQVEQWAATRGEREIQAEEIGERVMQHLHALDPVAYVRFVSVYRSFASVQEFAHLLHEMEKAAQADPEGQRRLFEIDARGQIVVPAREPGEADEPPADDGGEDGDAG